MQAKQNNVETTNNLITILKMIPDSAGKATLTISKRKVNQLSDPILQMLHMVHKIIYICQLPPTLCPNSRRRMIERYKRVLFSPQSNTMNLKDEISKVSILT